MDRTLYQRFQIWFIQTFAKIHVKQTKKLDDAERAYIQEACAKDYYLILTKRSNYFSAFMINFGHWFLTGRWGFFTHVLMNLEDTVEDENDFRFIEATGTGTHYSSFGDVFDPVDAVALLKPKSMTLEEWTAALDRAKTYLGTPYDNLLDLKNNLEINCVELIRLALESLPDYSTRFADLERIVAKYGKLTPSMFADCTDFEIVWVVKK